MAIYKVDRVKPVSNRRRYEHLRHNGIMIPTGVGGQHDIIRGQALDDYLDKIIWCEAHPGEDPIMEISDGVPEKRKVKRGGAVRQVRKGPGNQGSQG